MQVLRKKILEYSTYLLTLFSGCAFFNPTPIIEPKPEQLEVIINKSLGHLSQEEYTDAKKMLDSYQAQYGRDVGYQALRAIINTATGNYGDAEKIFREELLERFERTPEIIITVRDRLRQVFKMQIYDKFVRAMHKYQLLIPGLCGVEGLVSLAEQNFEQAAASFELALPYYTNKRVQYKELMNRLVFFAQHSGDMIYEAGFRQVAQVFDEDAVKIIRKGAKHIQKTIISAAKSLY